MLALAKRLGKPKQPDPVPAPRGESATDGRAVPDSLHGGCLAGRWARAGRLRNRRIV